MGSSYNSSDKIVFLHEKVKQLLRQGKSEEEIVEELAKDKIDTGYATMIIDNVQNDIHDRKSFWRLIFSGLFFVLGGLAINYLSYKIAVTANSLFFYLFWGIVVAGVVMIIRAFIIFKK
ncbi:MAG: hypothetical protein ABI480_14255 [Chitinophagaceae bacterium]